MIGLPLFARRECKEERARLERPLRCVFASQKSNEVSPFREQQHAPAQKLDRSRFFGSTILPRKSHLRQEQLYALGAAAK